MRIKSLKEYIFKEDTLNFDNLKQFGALLKNRIYLNKNKNAQIWTKMNF